MNWNDNGNGNFDIFFYPELLWGENTVFINFKSMNIGKNSNSSFLICSPDIDALRKFYFSLFYSDSFVIVPFRSISVLSPQVNIF